MAVMRLGGYRRVLAVTTWRPWAAVSARCVQVCPGVSGLPSPVHGWRGRVPTHRRTGRQKTIATIEPATEKKTLPSGGVVVNEAWVSVSRDVLRRSFQSLGHSLEEVSLDNKTALRRPGRTVATDHRAGVHRVVHVSILCDPIQPNPTHQLTDPTQPNRLQVEKFGLNPTQPTTANKFNCLVQPNLI